MQLRTLTRLCAAGALVMGIAGGVLTALAPAGALEQERVVLTEAGEFIYDYAPIIGNNPGVNVDASTFYDETTCSGVGCDMIPLTITRPSTADEDFFVTILIEWSTQEIPNAPVLGDTAVNDLDVYVLNDPRVEDAGPDEDGFAYKSTGAAEPEQINMFSPEGDFNILVANVTGPNTGYRLRFKVITDDIPDSIFESLPPAFSGGPQLPARPTATTIPTPTFDVAPPPTVSIEPATPPVADQSFDTGFDDGPSLEDQLAVGEPVVLQPAAVRRPSAPSNIALLLWLGAVPLLLVALFGAFVLRKQRNLLPGLS